MRLMLSVSMHAAVRRLYDNARRVGLEAGVYCGRRGSWNKRTSPEEPVRFLFYAGRDVRLIRFFSGNLKFGE
jgi:hypothetical protein